MNKVFPGEPSIEKEAYQTWISAELAQNLQMLNTYLTDCEDVIFAHFHMRNGLNASFLYLRGSVDAELLDSNVLLPLKNEVAEHGSNIESFKDHINVSDLKTLQSLGEILHDVLEGRPVVLIDTVPGALSIGLTKFEARSVEEPLAESVVRGSREGFIESLTVNTSLIRKRLKTPALKFVSFTVGAYSKTDITMGYIQGIAKPEIIRAVSDQIKQMNIDGVLESGYIEEFIENSNYSPFPQLQTTERPDVAAASLLEGRIIIITDNTPMVLIAPATFWTMMQSPEDYYQRFMIGTLIRWLRYTFFLIALLAPAVYVAVLTFHQEMVPTTLLLRVAKSREEIPFPALVEALIMEVTFEALREAGIRLPRQVGSAVSIVGALVIGQAAIQAGLVSAPMVMVVAITGISSFMMPQYSASIALRILRFPIMILSGILGLFGLILGLLLVISHLCILRSFGVPYMAPLAPISLSGIKDVLFRAPVNKLKTRPSIYSQGNMKRQGDKPDGK
ncbi:spore germination protein [Paenibacillus aceris]|uniref:Spore germination protein KA n=1 Tax=Paenibacillus aceris TaxID=869555 RepID=A0ABS4I0R1_9BACL|nr:spore germination protein [Paenibacillus aceris]MBP1964503.1 spore germination protein KA [Paenibacillus aceris]NHW35787.1 spore germination protein [Paenibacillus aceris]